MSHWDSFNLRLRRGTTGPDFFACAAWGSPGSINYYKSRADLPVAPCWKGFRSARSSSPTLSGSGTDWLVAAQPRGRDLYFPRTQVGAYGYRLWTA